MHAWRVGLVLLAAATPALAGDEFDKEPIRYSAGTPDNVVSRLQQKLVAGTAKLDAHEERGYLDSLLRALDVPASSQMLV